MPPRGLTGGASHCCLSTGTLSALSRCTATWSTSGRTWRCSGSARVRSRRCAPMPPTSRPRRTRRRATKCHQMPRGAKRCHAMPRDAALRARARGCSPTHPRLQPHPPKAATPPTQGCKPIHPRLQAYAGAARDAALQDGVRGEHGDAARSLPEPCGGGAEGGGGGHRQDLLPRRADPGAPAATL